MILPCGGIQYCIVKKFYGENLYVQYRKVNTSTNKRRPPNLHLAPPPGEVGLTTQELYYREDCRGHLSWTSVICE